jgi:hypothetical protein
MLTTFARTFALKRSRRRLSRLQAELLQAEEKYAKATLEFERHVQTKPGNASKHAEASRHACVGQKLYERSEGIFEDIQKLNSDISDAAKRVRQLEAKHDSWWTPVLGVLQTLAGSFLLMFFEPGVHTTALKIVGDIRDQGIRVAKGETNTTEAERAANQ